MVKSLLTVIKKSEIKTSNGKCTWYGKTSARLWRSCSDLMERDLDELSLSLSSKTGASGEIPQIPLCLAWAWAGYDADLSLISINFNHYISLRLDWLGPEKRLRSQPGGEEKASDKQIEQKAPIRLVHLVRFMTLVVVVAAIEENFSALVELKRCVDAANLLAFIMEMSAARANSAQISVKHIFCNTQNWCTATGLVTEFAWTAERRWNETRMPFLTNTSATRAKYLLLLTNRG